MKIGLLSDTHGYLDKNIFKYFEDCDEIWHAGDIGSIDISDQLKNFKKFRAVYGNIDGNILRYSYPEELVFEIEGLKVFIKHIGGYPPKYNPDLRKRLDILNPNLFICGHSHIVKIIKDPERNLLHINPGACGKHGFHHVRSIIRFDISKGKIENLQLIELGKRAKKIPVNGISY
jgi:putative phosphoesterase